MAIWCLHDYRLVKTIEVISSLLQTASNDRCDIKDRILRRIKKGDFEIIEGFERTIYILCYFVLNTFIYLAGQASSIPYLFHFL